MNQEGMLARLLSQAAGDCSDLVTLRAIVEESSETGANRALDQLGFSNDSVTSRAGDLSEILEAWRDAKNMTWRAAIGWVAGSLLALFFIGLGVWLGLSSLLK